MRILQVAHYFLPKHRGGVEVYTYNLSKELQKNHEVIIYCREDGYFNKVYCEANDLYDGLKLRRIFYNIPLTPETSYRNELIDENFNSFLDEIKPDIIHFQHLERMSVTLIDVAKQKGIPTVLTLHDYWFICPLTQLLFKNNEPCPISYSDERCLSCIKTWFKKSKIRHYYEKMSATGLSIINKRSRLMQDMLDKLDVIIAPSEFLRKRFIKD